MSLPRQYKNQLQANPILEPNHSDPNYSIPTILFQLYSTRIYCLKPVPFKEILRNFAKLTKPDRTKYQSLVDFVITVPVLILVLGRVQAEEQHAEPPPEAGRLQELHQEGHKARYGRQVELKATKIDMSDKLK
jgi:hypothetical protein